MPVVRARLCAPAVLAVLLGVPAGAHAAGPTVESARCSTGTAWNCQAGAKLTIRGPGLEKVTAVAFLGGRGGRDDRFAEPVRTSRARAVVVVPAGTRTGPLRVRTATAVTRGVRLPASGLASEANMAVSKTDCATGTARRCDAGERLVIRGDGLKDVTPVAFMGDAGGRDDALVRLVPAPKRVVLGVPAEARPDRLRVRTPEGVIRTSRSLRVTQAALSQGAAGRGEPAMAFPIDGAHDMGQTETNNFGGGRNHQGHDLFATCGTPVVAITSGVVQQKAYHSAAGHYVVLKDNDGASYAYMHLRSPGSVSTDERVAAGQRIGHVGETGRATGCHLHFEQWTAPGWYAGGRAIDPLPLLRRLEGEHSH